MDTGHWITAEDRIPNVTMGEDTHGPFPIDELSAKLLGKIVRF